MAPRQWRPWGGTSEEEEGGLGGSPVVFRPPQNSFIGALRLRLLRSFSLCTGYVVIDAF
jgi:hypothetical protein